MRELDLLLEQFLEHRYANLSRTEREDFERLLEHPNEDLVTWLTMGTCPEDERLAGIIRRIREPEGP
jgi:antitoxin CptB